MIDCAAMTSICDSMPFLADPWAVITLLRCSAVGCRAYTDNSTVSYAQLEQAVADAARQIIQYHEQPNSAQWQLADVHTTAIPLVAVSSYKPWITCEDTLSGAVLSLSDEWSFDAAVQQRQSHSRERQASQPHTVRRRG